MTEEKYFLFCDNIEKELLLNNPMLRENTIKSYCNTLWRLCEDLEEETRYIGNIPFILLKDYEKVTDFILNSEKGKSAKKSHFSVIISLCRGMALDNPGVCAVALAHYRKNHESLLKEIGQKQIEQKPSKKEEIIKTLNMDMLKNGLKYHSQALKKNPNDIESAVLLMAGTLSTELMLRNEPADMVISNKYLDEITHPKTNYLWNKGRNKKYIIIRENKVRVGGRDEEKRVEIKGHLNRTINAYLRSYWSVDPSAEDAVKEGDIVPLLYKTKGDISKNISGPGYCSMLKRVWAHMDIKMTSTLIRKTFAIDIRKKHGGKLKEEIEACNILDHGMGVHNTNYILFFE